MSLQTKVIGRQPTDHGPYDPELAYGKKFQCTLFGCAWESLRDNNNTAPAVWDGGDTITPNLVDWKKVSGSYEAWLMNHDKPATSEQYPYNGMGRVRLQKNIVNGVNTLTQAMLTQQNTIYVIQYDFTLGEDITVPENCVLEFDGGSISGAHTITGTNTNIIGNASFSNVLFDGTYNLSYINSNWFSYSYYPNIFKAITVLSKSDNITKVHFEKIVTNFDVTADETIQDAKKAHIFIVPSNTEIDFCGSIFSINGNDIDVCRFFVIDDSNNVSIKNVSVFGDVESHTKISTVYNEDCHGFYITGNSGNILLENVVSSKFWGDGLVITGQKNTVDYQGPHDIRIINGLFDKNRRQGCSITCGKRLFFESCNFTNTGRINYTAPGSGIDIEPILSYSIIEDIVVSNCRFLNNIGENLNKDVIINTSAVNTAFSAESIVFEDCVVEHQISQRGSGGFVKNCILGDANIQGSDITFLNNVIKTASSTILYTSTSIRRYFFNNIVENNTFYGGNVSDVGITADVGKKTTSPTFTKCLEIKIPKRPYGCIKINLCLTRYDIDTNHDYSVIYSINNGNLTKVKDVYYLTNKPLTDSNKPFAACCQALSDDDYFYVYILPISMFSSNRTANIVGNMEIIPKLSLEDYAATGVTYTTEIQNLDYTVIE